MSFDYFYGPQAEQFSFFRIPKILFTDDRFRHISTDAKVLYGLMLDRVSLSAKNNWMDKQGRVYIIFTLQEIMDEMHCGDQKATKLQVELEKKCGLIERKRQGQGKPTLIYVKNFISDSSESPVKNRENHESGMQTPENHDSGFVENENQDSPKSRGNNTDNIQTDFNHTDPILSSDGNGVEVKGKKEMRLFLKKQLEVDILLRNRPRDRFVIDEIIEILADVLCSGGRIIRIARDDKPAAEVKANLLLLRMEHIEFVLDCMTENTTKVKNMKQYLLTSLYNAPMTIHNYYTSLVQHDMNSGTLWKGE